MRRYSPILSGMGDNVMDVDKMFLMMKEYERYEKIIDEKGRDFTYKDYLEKNGGKPLEQLLADWRKKADNINNEQARKLYLENVDKIEALATEQVSSRKIKRGEIQGIKKFPKSYLKYEAESRKMVKYSTYQSDIKTHNNGKIDIKETVAMRDVNPSKRKATRNNLYVELAGQILGSPAGSRINFQAGQFTTAKAADRLWQILNDQDMLEEFAIANDCLEPNGDVNIDKVLNVVYQMMADDIEAKDDQYASLDNFVKNHKKAPAIGDPTAYMRKHSNLMAGNDLIGISAVNSSQHYKFQNYHLTLKEPIPFIPSDDSMISRDKNTKQPIPIMLKDVDAVYAHKALGGRRIGSIMAEWQAASPDNGKDPVLGGLNINPDTFYLVAGTSALGIGHIDSSIINSIIVRNYIVGINTDEFVDAQSVIPFNGNMKDLLSMAFKVKRSTQKDSGVTLNFEDYAVIAGMQQWWNRVDAFAKARDEASAISRVDSPNGALKISSDEAIIQLEKMKKFMEFATSVDCPIDGFENMIDTRLNPMDPYTWTEYLKSGVLRDDWTPETATMEDFMDILASKDRMQGYYSFGIKAGQSIAEKLLPQMSPKFVDGLRQLLRSCGITDLTMVKSQTLRNVIDDFSTYVLSGMSLFENMTHKDGTPMTLNEIRKYYLESFPLVFMMMQKDENDTILKKLPVNSIMTVDRSNKGISTASLKKTTTLSRRMYESSFDQLLGNAYDKARALARDLSLYTYFHDGYHFGPKNFGVFMTTSFIEGTTDGGYSAELRRASEVINDKSLMDRFFEQVIINHPEIVPKKRLKVNDRYQFSKTTYQDENGEEQTQYFVTINDYLSEDPILQPDGITPRTYIKCPIKKGGDEIVMKLVSHEGNTVKYAPLDVNYSQYMYYNINGDINGKEATVSYSYADPLVLRRAMQNAKDNLYADMLASLPEGNGDPDAREVNKVDDNRKDPSAKGVDEVNDSKAEPDATNVDKVPDNNEPIGMEVAAKFNEDAKGINPAIENSIKAASSPYVNQDSTAGVPISYAKAVDEVNDMTKEVKDPICK